MESESSDALRGWTIRPVHSIPQHPARRDSVPAQAPGPFPFITIIGGNPHFLPRAHIFPNRHRTLRYEMEKSVCSDRSLGNLTSDYCVFIYLLPGCPALLCPAFRSLPGFSSASREAAAEHPWSTAGRSGRHTWSC